MPDEPTSPPKNPPQGGAQATPLPPSTSPSAPLPTPSEASADPASYLRTYAKDLAIASGKPIPQSPLATKQTLQEAVADDAAKVPATPAEPKVDPWTAPPPPSGRGPDEILAGLKEKAIAENAPRLKNVIALDESRGEILNRLLSRSGNKPQPPPEPPPGVPLVQKPLVRDSAALPTPVPLAPSRIHTFGSDFSGQVKERKANTFAVLAAEQDKKNRTIKELPPQKTNPLPIIAGIALLFLGGLGIYFAYQFATKAPPIPVVLNVPSLIFADGHLELTGQEPFLSSLRDAAETPLPDGNVIVTYITSATSTNTGILTTPQGGGVLIRLLGLKAPDVLLRNIKDESTVGIVHAERETRPFFILRVTSFERTFAGMLAWEPLMERDLALIYPPYEPEVLPILEEVASSSPLATTTTQATTSVTSIIVPLNTLDLGPGEFVDEVVRNHDVRILYDGSGRSIMLYGYKDKETLIIARDKPAFIEILNRLSSTRTN